MGCFEQEEEAKNSPEKATAAAAGVVTRESFSSAIVVGKRHIETCHLHREERDGERGAVMEREREFEERERGSVCEC